MSAKKTKNTTENIEIRGARQHNLKNISINIPKDQLIIISGVSGSGKSSLALTLCLLKDKDATLKAFHHTQDNSLVNYKNQK